MLTVGGLLLSAVLTAPVSAAGAAPADLLEPTSARITIAQDLRDPFAPDSDSLRAAATGRTPRPSNAHADLRDPFEAVMVTAAQPGLETPAAAASPEPEAPADLRSPFAEPSVRAAAPPPSTALRDPFLGR